MTDDKTFLPYDRPEVESIRQSIVTKGAGLICPLCDGPLAMGPPLGGGGSVEFVWQVHCSACCRSAVVRNLPYSKGD